jgi:hypothetical protein
MARHRVDHRTNMPTTRVTMPTNSRFQIGILDEGFIGKISDGQQRDAGGGG